MSPGPFQRERERGIKDRHLKEKLQQISQTGHGQKILKKLDEDDIKKLDADQNSAGRWLWRRTVRRLSATAVLHWR
jgi:hypothetical protein